MVMKLSLNLWRKLMLEFILATATIVGQVQVNAYTYETNFLTQDNELITVVQEVEPDQIFEGC